jgi:hypothetical protein
MAAVLVLCGLTSAAATDPRKPDPPRSSAWLALLPDGEAKRKFILDCTGCHQFDEKIARPQGSPRTEAQWVEAVTRIDVLPRGSAARVGGSPQRRVVSITLRNRLSTVALTAGYRVATEGDWAGARGEAIFTRIRGPRRFNVALRVRDEDRLREVPDFSWIRLGPPPDRLPLNAILRDEVRDGMRIRLARAEVLNCQLEQPLSLAQRRNARSTSRHCAAGARPEDQDRLRDGPAGPCRARRVR